MPNLSPADQLKVNIGNQLMTFTTNLMQLSLQRGLPCCLENQVSSRLFHAPGIVAVLRRSMCVQIAVDQCFVSGPPGENEPNIVPGIWETRGTINCVPEAGDVVSAWASHMSLSPAGT